MRNPFTARRPWVAFLLALFLGPYIGMLYLGRARLAGVYFISLVALAVGVVLAYPHYFDTMPLVDVIGYAQLPYTLVGAGHTAYLAWKHPFAAPGRWYTRWYAIIGFPVAYVLLLLGNRDYLYPFYYVPSHAMEPTIGLNDVIFASRISFRFREPARGDVVALHRLNQGDVTYVKRIIGIPGDRVQMRSGIVILNGKPLSLAAQGGHCCVEVIDGRRHFISKNYETYTDDTAEVSIPAGWYYVLGDNRSNSLDSRYAEFGLVARKDIIGPVVLKFFDGEAWRFTLQSVR